MDGSPFDRVSAFFTGDALDLAVKALRSYYGPDHHYTGSAFDELILSSHPNRYTSDDLVAVSMLSVTVPPRAALTLLGGAATRLLAAIPTSASLWEQPGLLDRDGVAWQLWTIVSNMTGSAQRSPASCWQPSDPV